MSVKGQQSTKTLSVQSKKNQRKFAQQKDSYIINSMIIEHDHNLPFLDPVTK